MKYNPVDRETQLDPYAHYKWLRENEPVYYVEELNAWAITRYEDVKHVLKRHDLFSSDPLIQIAFGDFNPAPGAAYVLSSDQPDHTRLRRVLGAAFSNKIVQAQTPRIVELCSELIPPILNQDRVDFVPAFTSPLPVVVIAEMMGIDSDRREDFRKWSNEITLGSADISEAQRAAIKDSAKEFRAYFEDVIERRRKQPGPDLLSAMISAQEEHGKLTADEVLAFCVLLLVAGNETTTSTVGNTLYLLSKYPEQKKLVMEDRSLIPNLVEESLRYISPIQLLFRRTREPVEIAGISLPADAIVMPIYGSANRDESVFKNADTFDITRGDLKAHMAFGHGIHHCMGALLGRHESTQAIAAVLDQMPNYEVDFEAGVDWIDAFYLKGPKVLPLMKTGAK